MDHPELQRRFGALTTAHLADACLRARVPLRCAFLHAVVPGSRLAGRVAPARHVGSVDIFLEVLEGAGPGDVLVVDNGGGGGQRVGECTVTGADLVLGDDDGVLFVPAARAAELFTIAEAIRDTERRQADQIRAGVPLRRQLQFDRYLARREQTPSLSFRDHLRVVGGAIEE